MLDIISFSQIISLLKIPIIETVVAGAKQTPMDVVTDEDAPTDQETAEIHASLKEQKRLQLQDKEARGRQDTKDTLQDIQSCYSRLKTGNLHDIIHLRCKPDNNKYISHYYTISRRCT